MGLGTLIWMIEKHKKEDSGEQVGKWSGEETEMERCKEGLGAQRYQEREKG